MICPINAGGTKTRQCVGERCAWFVTLYQHGKNDIKACAVPWIACSAVGELYGDDCERRPLINDYKGRTDEG